MLHVVQMFQFQHCACCGNRYIVNHQSIYKLSINGHVKRFCSYGCYHKIQKLREERKYDDIDSILNAAKIRAEELKAVEVDD